MNDMKTIIQDELRQALPGLRTTPATAPTPVIVNPPIVDAPLANNDNAGGAIFECC